VPDGLRPVIGQREIKRSLKTPNPEETRNLAFVALVEIKQLVAIILLLH
jgi:hypothetical protein